MLIMEIRPHNNLEILSTQYRKDFICLKLRTSNKKIGYIIYSKEMDFYYYEE